MAPESTQVDLLFKSSKICNDRRFFGQSVLVSGTHLGPMTRFHYFRTVASLPMWGVLFDERTGLDCVPEVEAEVKLLPTVSCQSVLVSGTHLGPATNFSFSLKCS
jgi:hypothetical protein